MRKVEASATIRKPARLLWRAVSDIRNWEAFSETFAGWGFKFRYAVTAGPKDPPADGTRIAVTDAAGRPVMECRISLWDAPRRFELTAQRDTGLLKSYRLLLSVNLSELDDDLTNAEIGFVVMFGNRFVELASLLLPVRFLYRRRLAAVLERLRQAAA